MYRACLVYATLVCLQVVRAAARAPEPPLQYDIVWQADSPTTVQTSAAHAERQTGSIMLQVCCGLS
jgi:hypothetical protein